MFGLLANGVVRSFTRGLNGIYKLELLSLSGTLRSLIAGPLTDVESSLSVVDVHPFGGDCLLDKISFVFLESILMEMIDVPFSLNPLAEDMTISAFSSNGVFSLYSAYALSKGLNPLNTSLKLESSWIWKAFTTPRIKYFLWLCFHHSLPTCEVLSIRGINVNPACSMCNSFCGINYSYTKGLSCGKSFLA